MSNSEKLRFRILAPSLERIPTRRLNATVDPKRHAQLLFNLQVLRGTAYREYHPLATGLTPDGRHVQQIDNDSWHILLEGGDDRIIGCARYRQIRGGFGDLGARHSTLAQSLTFGAVLRRAVESHIRRARAAHMEYGEAGAWALCPKQRCSTAAVSIALMTFALADRLGGGMGITTATTRHHSASMLRRLGGQRLAGLPAYYDPKYGCVIEILGFEMKRLSNRFARKLEHLKSSLESIQVICRSGTAKENFAYAAQGLVAAGTRAGAWAAIN